MYCLSLLFIGVMEEGSSDVFQQDEINAHHPPSSLVPRLHCLVMRPLSELDEVVEHVSCFNLKRDAIQEGALTGVSLETQASYMQWRNSGQLNTNQPAVNMTECRDRVLALLANSMQGDYLAAYYVLAELCCRVTGRADGMPIGYFPLNLIFGQTTQTAGGTMQPPPPPVSMSELQDVVDSLLPRTTAVNLDVRTLEHPTKLLPIKDYSANRLCHSSLQLPPNSCVVINEFEMELYHEQYINKEGGGTNSKKCLSKLQELVTSQELIYDFQFYQMNYKTDYSFICCSRNSPSILNSSCKLHVVPTMTQQQLMMGEIELVELRYYIALVKQSQVVGFANEAVTQLAENDMVTMKQADAAVTGACFSRLLTLSRFLSAAEGLTEVNEPQWHKAFEMETERRNRCKN